LEIISEICNDKDALKSLELMITTSLQNYIPLFCLENANLRMGYSLYQNSISSNKEVSHQHVSLFLWFLCCCDPLSLNIHFYIPKDFRLFSYFKPFVILYIFSNLPSSHLFGDFLSFDKDNKFRLG